MPLKRPLRYATRRRPYWERESMGSSLMIMESSGKSLGQVKDSSRLMNVRIEV